MPWIRRTFAIMLLQAAVISAVVGLSATAGRPTLAQDQSSTFTRLDGVNIYFAESNREATAFDRTNRGLSRFAGLLYALGANINVLDWRKDIPADADLVVINAPTRDIDDAQSARLWAYLNRGGSLLLLVDPLTVREDQGVIAIEMNDRTLRSDRGLFVLTWSGYGVRARDDVIVAETGDGGLSRDFTTVDVNSRHPILRNVTGPLAFFGARSIEVDASIQPYSAQPLVYTGSQYYGETAYVDYLQLNIELYNPGIDTPRGRLPVIAASENRTTGARVVVIGDGGFAANGEGFLSAPSNTAGFVFPANVQFMMNAVAWLVNADVTRTETFEFPTPGPTATPTPAVTPTATPEIITTPEAESADETTG